MTALNAIAERLEVLAGEIDNGNTIEPDSLRIEARRIRMQIEMIEEGLHV